MEIVRILSWKSLLDSVGCTTNPMDGSICSWEPDISTAFLHPSTSSAGRHNLGRFNHSVFQHYTDVPGPIESVLNRGIPVSSCSDDPSVSGNPGLAICLCKLALSLVLGSGCPFRAIYPWRVCRRVC